VFSSRLLAITLIYCAASSAQVVYGAPTTSVTAVLTVTATGTGAGSVTSADGLISSCSSGGGTCTATYNIGASVTLTPTATGGSTFNWSSGTDGASVCSGSGACTFNITTTAGVSAVFSSGGTILATPTFGLDYNVGAANFPVTINHGVGRFWDSPSVEWPFVETSNNSFNWTNVDGLLAAMLTNSVHTAQVALARTPYFATSANTYTDAGTCSYVAFSATANNTALSETGSTVTVTSSLNPGTSVVVVLYGDTPSGYDGVWTTTASNSTSFQFTSTVTGLGPGTGFGKSSVPSNLTNSAPGQCDPPTDLNADGSGTDLFFRNWVGAYSAHVNAGGYTNTHAHVGYWEVWNEPDTGKFWSTVYGTYDQLIRMQQDAYCIIKGGAYITPGSVTTGSFTTGEAVTQNTTGATATLVGAPVGGAPMDFTAAPTGSPDSTHYWLGGSSSARFTPTAVPAALTVRATGESCATVRAAVTSVSLSGPVDTTAFVVMPSYHAANPALGFGKNYLYCNNSPGTSCHTGGSLTTDEINFHMKPGANLESQMSSWVTAVNGILSANELAKGLFNTEGGYSASGWVAPYTDADMQASYIARFYIYSYSLGVTNDVWYYYTGGSGLGSSTANTAYSQVYNWMVGSTFGSCTSVTTVWTCTMTLPDGNAAAAIWDTSQSCSAGSCTTVNQTVNSSYLHYLTLAGGAPISISGHIVPVGIKPLFMKAE
jgi:hypothetical protein